MGKQGKPIVPLIKAQVVAPSGDRLGRLGQWLIRTMQGGLAHSSQDNNTEETVVFEDHP